LFLIFIPSFFRSFTFSFVPLSKPPMWPLELITLWQGCFVESFILHVSIFIKKEDL